MKLARLFVAPVLLTLVACARDGARPSAPAPPRDEAAERPPSTIEEAEEQIADAQLQLGGGARESPRGDIGGAAPPPPPAPPAQSSPPSSSSDTNASQTKAASPAPDACTSPCRAFASMHRAVDALCRMTGETDDRCVRARRTLATSTGRVASCRCGS